MINKILRKLLYGNKADSKTYIEYLRSLGMKIGEETTIYVPTKTQIDTTRPWLISIGNNVKITEDVTILTHGFDWSVLKGVYGDILGSGGVPNPGRDGRTPAYGTAGRSSERETTKTMYNQINLRRTKL